MKELPKVSVLIGCLLAGCSPREPEVVEGRPVNPLAKGGGAVNAAQAEEDTKDIRALFDRYWDALAKRQGDQVVACFDRKTLQWYEQLRQDTLRLSREDLRKENLHRQLMILQFRNEFDRGTLTRLNGQELLALGYRRGWLQHEAARQKLALGYVGSNGKSAHATLASAPELPAFFFEKEGDGWKINETGLHESVLGKLKALQRESGLEESNFLVTYLTELSGKKVDERILDGPLDKLPS
jgi:hypothetical protein